MSDSAKRDAHYRVLTWSRALVVQVERLRADRADAVQRSEQVRLAGVHKHEDSWPFHVMAADAHFALVAARQLLRALRAFDGDARLPVGLSSRDMRLVRDALEHWDEPDGPANSRMRELGADPSAHRWSVSGSGVLAGIVSDELLATWASSVYDELVAWDPW